MAIALRGQSSFSTGASNSVSTATAATPGSPVAGDFCMIWADARNATKTFTATGFTVVTVKQANSQSAQFLYRVIDGTESWPITVTASATGTFTGQCICYSGVNTTTPFDPSTPAISAQTNAASTNVTPASITTTISGDQLVWFGAASSLASGGVPPTITVPPGTTPTFTAQSAFTVTSTGAAFNIGSIVADGTWASSGATAPVGTVGSAVVNAALLVALEASGGNFSAAGVTATIAFAAPVGSVSVTLPGVSATVVLAAPVGSVSVTIPGVTATVAMIAPVGSVSVSIPGVTATVAIAARVGSVSVTIPGVTASILTAAPSPTVSVTIPGVRSKINLVAKVGGFTTTAAVVSLVYLFSNTDTAPLASLSAGSFPAGLLNSNVAKAGGPQ